MTGDDSALVAVVCDHVFRGERPVRLVVRHRDLGWQMTCGETDHDPQCEDFQVVHAVHLFERQANLRLLGDLKPGTLADWTGDEWDIAYHDD